MKLNLISEVNINRAISKISPLFNILPKNKRKHSKRVALQLNKIGIKKEGVYAGLLHDYLENGGSILELSDRLEEIGLPESVITIVRYLTHDDIDPLDHIKSEFDKINNQDLKNLIILIKLSDRLDNLHKRSLNRISDKYKRKSAKLVEYLVSQYTGNQKLLHKLLKQIGRLIEQ